MRKLAAALIIVFLTVPLIGCNVSNAVNATISMNDNETCLNIITTNKMLYMAVKEIVKDKHYVRYMFKDGDSQWNFNYTQDSIENIAKQDLFIYSGADAEPWIDDFINKLSKGKVGIINASRGANILSGSAGREYNGKVIDQNPYYYLSTNNYKIILLNIKNAIEEKDSKNRKFYEQNFSEAIKNIDNLDKRLKVLDSKMKNSTIIVDEDDDTYDYFIKDNNMKVIYMPQYKLTDYEKFSKDMAQFENQLNSLSNVYYFYKNENQLKSNKEIIDKYAIVPINIDSGNFDKSASSLLDYDISNLEKIFLN